MIANTTNYGLYVTDDNTETFQSWREAMNATTNSNMTKIDSILAARTKIYTGSCTTAASTAAKTVTLDDSTGFSLTAGVMVVVRFTNGNTATTPTLNVNSSGAKTIAIPSSATAYTTGNGTTYNTWGARESILFTYTGAYWTHIPSGYLGYLAYSLASGKQDALPSQSGNSGKFLTTDGSALSWGEVDALPSQSGNSGKFLTTNGTEASWEMPPSGVYYGECSTAAATQGKTVTITDFPTTLTAGLSVRIKFTNAQTYAGAPTLQINSTGANTVRYLSGSNGFQYMWNAGEILDFVYDGTYWVVVDGGTATTTYYGATKLSSSTSSTSTLLAATPSAVKAAYDKAVEAYDRITYNEDDIAEGSSLSTGVIYLVYE